MYYGGAPNAVETAGKVVKPFGARRFKRMNVIAICASLFIPWIVGCSTFALVTFSFHYRHPTSYSAVCMVVGGILVSLWLRSLLRFFMSDDFAAEAGILTNEEYHPELLTQHVQRHEEKAAGSWSFFILTMSLFFFIAGYVVGKKSFLMNTQPYYDLSNLNAYNEVNPETVHGQELMDAGLVQFNSGTTVDLKRIMSFRNMDTYCVAPIMTGIPLASYDFWAVGLNCCGDGPGNNFTCGAIDDLTAHGGVRVMRNEDRAFYRLAVQQAQSAYNIRANHPLFFYWSANPKVDAHNYLKDGFRSLFVFMYAGFFFQLLLVATISCQKNSLINP